MPKKPAPKDARKRTKKPGKIADLPVKSLKGKDAAAVKGGSPRPALIQEFHKDLSTVQLDNVNLNTTLNIDKA